MEVGGAVDDAPTKYMTADHLGSTRIVTRADQTVANRFDFSPYGEELAATLGGRMSRRPKFVHLFTYHPILPLSPSSRYWASQAGVLTLLGSAVWRNCDVTRWRREKNGPGRNGARRRRQAAARWAGPNAL